MKDARLNYNGSNFMAVLALSVIGLQVVTALRKGGFEPNWNYALIAAGVVAISIPIKMSYHKKAANAFANFNEHQHSKVSTKYLLKPYLITG